MAPRTMLTELTAAFTAHGPHAVVLESAGGVDVARRVRDGEAFDVVALADDAVAALSASGHLLANSTRPLARSAVAVAVRAGAARPDVSSEEAVRRAVQAASSLGVSTGPSGTAVLQLFARWGLAPEVRARTMTAPPGVPVGTLVASGEVELGFQQLSELAHLDGIDVVGTLPPPIEIVTTFSAAVAAVCRQPDAARALLAFLTSPAADDTIRRHGMEPARTTTGAETPDR